MAKDGLDKLVKTRLINDYTEQPRLLRRENGLEDGYLLVGCMRTIKNAEQGRIFSMLPGCENIRFVKYGWMHRNIFFILLIFINFSVFISLAIIQCLKKLLDTQILQV